MFFFRGPYDDLYGPRRGTFGRAFVPPEDAEDFPRPSFSMTVNKVAEMVQLFGPSLYHRNPIRQVNPRRPPLIEPEAFGDPNDPQLQLFYQALSQQTDHLRAVDRARSVLLEQYLNYTPTALDLKTESRWAIDEAIIKGMGVLWSELYLPAAGGTKMVGSFFDSVDNLFIDPDMESLREAKWVARKCIHPVWEVEQQYGLEPGSLKANVESYGRQATIATDPDGDYNRRRGLTNDLLVYYKIYSKMGLGGRLSGAAGNQADTAPMRDVLDSFGNFTYLVVCESAPYPLNLPSQVIETAAQEEVAARVRWPTPFWMDDAWPFTPIAFHWVPREVWPMSHLRPGIGELKFINWAYSMLAGKVRTACRDFLAVAKSTSEDLKEQIRVGPDYTMIEVEAIHGSIDSIVKFLQHPGFNPDIYKVIESVTENFEKRVGLTELMYGLSNRQYRSSAEAQEKSAQTAIRPDDMANKVEDAMGEVARKEALAARWHLDGNDVAPVLGPLGAQWWMQFLTPADPAEVLHQLEYRIEAGSARKPNKARDAANMQQAIQTLFQPFWQFALNTADFGPVNKLISDWAKSIDLSPDGYLLHPPQPQPQMPPMPTAPGGPGVPGAAPQPLPAPATAPGSGG